MKSYAEHMNEISPEELKVGLISHGLFTNKLPPFFTSQVFLRYLEDEEPDFTVSHKDFIRYENIRNINVPRILAIPEPFAYAKHCDFISKNWELLQNYFEEKTQDESHKASRIHIRKMEYNVGLFEMNYKNFDDDGWPEIELLVKSKLVVRADISNFYPSIYTHAIAWALAGKEVAKSGAGRRKSNWYNKLDKHARDIKNAETSGILIGPDSSLIFSEVILVAVDKVLRDKGFKFIRHIDDYQCYVTSHEEAEAFLLHLATELKVYELTLNHKKTEILPLPLNSEPKWIRKLRSFHFPEIEKVGDKQVSKTNELFGYLDLAQELMTEFDVDRADIINYAIKTISTKYLNERTKSHYLTRIHHLVLMYPYLIGLLDDYVFTPFNISTQKIKAIAQDVYRLGLEKRIYEPCSFAMFFCIKYNFRIGVMGHVNKAIESNDCIFMTSTLIYQNTFALRTRVLKEKARQLKSNYFDQYWLFIYEALENHELAEPYSLMKHEGISFIKRRFRRRTA